MKGRTCKALVAVGMFCGCTVPSVAPFRAEIEAAHPPGSPVAALGSALRARGFVQGRPFGPPVDRQTCFVREIRLGWAGGTRHVCHDTVGGGIANLRVGQFVMSP